MTVTLSMLLLQFTLLRQHYLDKEMEKKLIHEYLADEPRLSMIKPDKMQQQSRTVVRNSRSHIVRKIKFALMAGLAHTKEDKDIKVCSRTKAFVVYVHVYVEEINNNSLALQQFDDADNILEQHLYRDAAPDKPYSAPLFHTILSRAFSTADHEVTVFDVGMADYLCDALLRGTSLRDASTGGLNAEYNKFVAAAKKMAGKTIKTPDGSSKLKMILRRPPR